MKYPKSSRSINEEGENISESEMGEEKSSKINKYDSSYFSKRMQDVDNKRGVISETPKDAETMKIVDMQKGKDLFSSKSPFEKHSDMQLSLDKRTPLLSSIG